MNRIYLLFIFLLTFHLPAGAIVDSSAVIMQKDWSTLDKIRWLNDYSARMLVEDNLIFAEKSALLAGKLSDETHFAFGKAKAIVHLGQVAYNKKSYAKAENYFREAVILFNTGGDKLSLARAKAMKADACFMENKLDSALSNYKEALGQFSLGIIDDNLLATIHKRTGDVYCYLNAYDKAASEYDDALKVYSEIVKNNKRVGELAYNIGIVLLNLKHKDEATTYFRISDRFFSQVPDIMYVTENFAYLSQAFEAIDDYESAEKITEKALMNYTALNNSAKIIENLIRLGWLNAILKKNKIAEDFLTKAEFLINNSTDKTASLKFYSLIGLAYEKLGNTEKSSKFYDLIANGTEELQKQKQLNVFNESILNYNDAPDGISVNPSQKPAESSLPRNKTQTIFRVLGFLFILGTLVFAGRQFVREKTLKVKANKKTSHEKAHLLFAEENTSDMDVVVSPLTLSETLREISAPEPVNTISENETLASTQKPESPTPQPIEVKKVFEDVKTYASPKEILDSISGHIEQIKRLQKILFDKQLTDDYARSFQALKTTTYELQVLVDSIHTSMRVKDSTILNTETFFAPNDVINYVKEQLFLPSRIPVTYHIDARLPSLLIGNGMRLSQIITQSIKGLSKPMIDGEVRINLSRSEIVGDELTVKLDIEASGTGFIFDRLEKIMNSIQPDDRSTDESEAALLFVKKLVKSKNDDIFIQRNAQKTILTAFLTFEIPIPNYLSMTDVHTSLLPRPEKKMAE